MSDFRRQFILSLDGRNRWRWALYEDGLHRVAVASTSYRSYDECIESIRQVAGIAQAASVWDAVHQRWDESANVQAPTAGIG